MNISITRSIEDLRDILQDPKSQGPQYAYWVFSGMNHKKWENVSITTPGKYGNEFPKTYGHYHTNSDTLEIYKLISGEGIFQFQKKHVENGKLIPDVVDEVFLIGAEVGDEIVVRPEFAHSWSNVGNTPLITFDNWREGHVPADYEPIKQQHGLAYYLISENNGIKAIPNPYYKNLPQPKWITAKEFMKLFD